MGGVGSAPTVAANEQFVSRTQTLFGYIGGARDLRLEFF
jgi:hypothetical protein